MTQWIKSDTKQIIDTAMGQGITVAGTYYLNRANMNHQTTFAFGAKTLVVTHTATLQLFAEVAGAKLNLGSPITPVFGTPVVVDEEYSCVGERGIIVTDVTGTVYPEAVQ